jgi:hypothetical protein
MLEGLRRTLDIARKSLPADAHPVHAARLHLVEQMVKRALEQEPDYWRESIAQVEQRADEMATRYLTEESEQGNVG